MIPSPINTQTTGNWDPTIITATTQQIFSLKLDQNFGAATKVNFFWNKQSTSAAAYADGLPEPLTTVRKLDTVVGGNQFRLNADRTISPTVLAHLGVGFWRFLNPDSAPASMLNYDVGKNLGLVGSTTGFGFPTISGLGYNNQGGLVTSQGSTVGITNSVFQQSDIASTWQSDLGAWHPYLQSRIRNQRHRIQRPEQQWHYGAYNFSGAQTAIPYLGTLASGPVRSAAPTPVSCWVKFQLFGLPAVRRAATLRRDGLLCHG